MVNSVTDGGVELTLQEADRAQVTLCFIFKQVLGRRENRRVIANSSGENASNVRDVHPAVRKPRS